ncbi:MAG: thioredoxin family protein [Kurthia sp.]|nr:thioredoxin family protein [Candidatus Kurthia equi]
MKTVQQYFETATPIEQYMDEMTTLKEEAFKIYNNFSIQDDSNDLQLVKDKSPHILVITENWCGDAMINNSILRRLAEQTDLDVRCVLRDEDTDLIDQFLTNGGRAIPIYVFLNDAGEVIGKWGPRAPELQQNVMNLRSELPDKEDPQFEQAQKDLYQGINEQYTTNEKFWNWVYNSQKAALLDALK